MSLDHHTVWSATDAHRQSLFGFRAARRQPEHVLMEMRHALAVVRTLSRYGGTCAHFRSVMGVSKVIWAHARE